MTSTATTPTSTLTTPTPDGALARAIEPVTVAGFLERHWERQPLHVPRGEPGRFDDLLSADAAERLVCEPGLRHPAFRLVQADVRHELRDYTVDLGWRPVPFTGTAEVGRVARAFEGGATIVLQGLHLNCRPLAVYCRLLEARLGHPVQANAYLTPRRSQGLPVHHDTHDVFVLQASGRKRWLVYEPALELPLKHQRYRAELGEPGEPVLDVVLEPGDTLYLPRGWLHEALTSDDDSLHVTVGVNVRTRLDLLRAALELAEADVELRRSSGPGDDGAGLVARVADAVASGRAAALLRRRFVAGRRPILEGQLGQLRALDGLTVETTVERRPTVIADFDGGRLSFEGKTLVFPAHAASAVTALVEAEGPVRSRDLPGPLDEAGRLVLVRRLVREGFLRILS
jgi:hypothetical protein